MTPSLYLAAFRVKPQEERSNFIMTSKVTYSGKDYGGETTRCGVYLPTVSSANYDTLVTSLNAIGVAVNAVTVDGVLSGKQFNALEVTAGAKATSKAAQREQKWLVTLIDGTDPLGNWRFEIPMADTALLTSDGENMDVSGGDGAALVTVLEANCVSRLGNAVTVESIKLVGRTL